MSTELSRLLAEANAGEPQAAQRLLPIVYQELRRLAAVHLAALRPGQTLQATALVHEAYLKLVGTTDPGWNGRGHFFGAASQAMREIIIDGLRRKHAQKRGGGVVHDDLETAIEVRTDGLGIDDLLALDGALTRLEAEHPRKARVVVMRYFGGLSEEEIAEALDINARTVERDWRFARAWLHAALTAGSA